MGGEGFAAVGALVLMLILAIGCISAGLTDDKVAHPNALIGIGVVIIAIEALFIACGIIAVYNDGKPGSGSYK